MDFGLESLVYEINKTSAKLAREAADTITKEKNDGSWRLVAGAVGPTNRTASVSPKIEDPALRNVTYMEIKEAYKE